MSKKDEGGWSDLGTISKVMDLTAKRTEDKRLEWQAAIGEPTKFVPDTDPDLAAKGFGTGFFRMDWGVLVITRYANGYSPNSVMRYENEFIDLLVEIRGTK